MIHHKGNFGFFVVGVFVFTFLFPTDVFSQYCIGYTEYGIRRPNGKALSQKRFNKLEFVSFDGAKREIVEQDGIGRVFYSVNQRNRFHTIEKNDRIYVIFSPCGQIDGMTLRYGGVEMKLLFGIGIKNTNFLIRALPFQDGIFRLRSLECADSKLPPRIDNENYGVCVVPETRWERIGRTDDGLKDPPPQ